MEAQSAPYRSGWRSSAVMVGVLTAHRTESSHATMRHWSGTLTPSASSLRAAPTAMRSFAAIMASGRPSREATRA